MALNVYLVVSETLTEVVCEDWFVNACHREEYRICELVAAESHSQARWMAWHGDRNSFTNDVRDMPKFAVRKKGTTDGEPRLLTEHPGWHLMPVWDIGDAPHIGIRENSEC